MRAWDAIPQQNVDVGAMVKEQVELAEKFAMEGT